VGEVEGAAFFGPFVLASEGEAVAGLGGDSVAGAGVVGDEDVDAVVGAEDEALVRVGAVVGDAVVGEEAFDDAARLNPGVGTLLAEEAGNGAGLR
jgi:hypothetical protein